MRLLDALPTSLRAHVFLLLAGFGFVLTASHLALRVSDFAETHLREEALSATVLAQSLAGAAFGVLDADAAIDAGSHGLGDEGAGVVRRLAGEASRTAALVRLELVDRGGVVAASTDPGRVGGKVPLARLSFGAPSPSLSAEVLTGAVEIDGVAVVHGPSGPAGYLSLVVRTDVVAKNLRRHVSQNLVLGLVWLGLVGWMAAPLVRRVSEPIQRLAEASASIADGRPPPPLPPATIGEVSVLQARFLAMARALDAERAAKEALLADLAARVRAATAELEGTNRFLAAVISSLRSGVLTTDLGGQVTSATPRALALLGAGELAALLGRPPPGLLAGDAVTGPLSRVLGGGPPESFQLGHPPGRAIEGDVTPLVGDDKRYGALIRFADVTERRRLELQLERAERMSAVATVAATFAHEVGNALHVILGHAKLLKAESPPSAPSYPDVVAIADESERAAALIQRFKLFSAPSRGKTVDLDLAGLAEDATRLVEPALRKARLRLDFAAGSDVPLVHGDPALIRQAILNVVLNAIQASPSGGTLKVFVEHLPGEPPRARLAVEDEGPGIPPELRARIFEPFFTTKPEGEGTGLGLSVVQTVMTLHGGEIEVEAGGSGGTRISLAFPAATSRARADSEAP